jgi:hypothetical protein
MLKGASILWKGIRTVDDSHDASRGSLIRSVDDRSKARVLDRHYR